MNLNKIMNFNWQIINDEKNKKITIWLWNILDIMQFIVRYKASFESFFEDWASFCNYSFLGVFARGWYWVWCRCRYVIPCCHRPWPPLWARRSQLSQRCHYWPQSYSHWGQWFRTSWPAWGCSCLSRLSCVGTSAPCLCGLHRQQ